MKNFFKDWNLRRFIYLFGGILFIFIAVNDRTWWFIPFAMYFIAMAIFKFGCASGNCETGIPTNNQK
ncbi:hypothetical protein [Chryseobacterium sp. MP_3.2]|uniref:hypothetical protein n=1 Tax=Chryseobacterium sp. MP_3.2 TaxID=3071712 RepID=UPI002E024148|nr:putative ion transporter superfamily protein YfcC [Chryseobacterium sp. MP_3.2]